MLVTARNVIDPEGIMETDEYAPPGDWNALYAAISAQPPLAVIDAAVPGSAVEAARRAWANTMALNNHGSGAAKFYNMTGIIAAFRDALFAAKPLLAGESPSRVARDDAPSLDDVMSLIGQYAVARLIANTTVPTKSQREVSSIVAGHERDEREVVRLRAEIAEALTRAGLT